MFPKFCHWTQPESISVNLLTSQLKSPISFVMFVLMEQTTRETLDKFCAMYGKATEGKVTFLNAVNRSLF